MKKKEKKPKTIYQSRREEARISQEMAAEKLDISSRTIQFIEAGKREPRLGVAFGMAELYGCSILDFEPEVKKKEKEKNREETFV